MSAAAFFSADKPSPARVSDEGEAGRAFRPFQEAGDVWEALLRHLSRHRQVCVLSPHYWWIGLHPCGTCLF